jgi:hypothetical protein
MGMIFGAIGGMKIGRGNRSTRRKPAPAPLCPPLIPHDQTRARTPGRRCGSRRITAWAMARPSWRDSVVSYGLDLFGFGYIPVEGSCEHGNEPSGSLKFWDILQWLRDWQFLNKNSAPWSYWIPLRHCSDTPMPSRMECVCVCVCVCVCATETGSSKLQALSLARIIPGVGLSQRRWV